MAETSLEISAGSPYSVLVTYEWGAANVARYCRWTDNITIGANVFTHEPTLRVLFDRPMDGGTQDAAPDIEMRTDKSPVNTLSDIYAHAPVMATIEEVDPTSVATTRQTLFKGRIGKVVVKPGGKTTLSRMSLVGPKKKLMAKMGLQALSTCPWIFGFHPCGYDLAGNSKPGTITQLNVAGHANRLRITIPAAPDMSNVRWNRGYIEVDGLKIQIRKSVNNGLHDFDLREIPPPSWDGLACLCVPGCDKQIETCRVHDQEQWFCGYGYAMPDRNPTFFAD